jgi:hypothetical protein
MTESNDPDERTRPQGGRRRLNAFERARSSALRFNLSIWEHLAKHLKKDVPEAELSRPEATLLGHEEATLGFIALERRTISLPTTSGRVVEWTLTRPLEPGWTTLPLELIEELATQLVEQAEIEQRAANIEAVIQAAQEFSSESALDLAREVLGPDATPEELHAFADQTRFPDEILAGGEAAARFFDEQVGTVRLEEDETGEADRRRRTARAGCRAPGR